MFRISKVYTDTDVLTAARERFNVIFNNFNRLYLCVSGGKDSSVMLQLCAEVARERGRTFSVLFVDLESQYRATIAHVEALRHITSDVVEEFFWCCLPLSLRNAVSVIQPTWICWDSNEKDRWVRAMPDYACVIHENNLPREWTWFLKGMEFEDFTFHFGRWYQQRAGEPIAVGIGIRSDESLHRYNTIISETKETFEDYGWTTKLRIRNQSCPIYNFYPIYDWKTEDIWGAVSRLDLEYNEIYELMFKNGLGIHQQRLCQPYGDDQRKGLDQFRALEPETWEKVVNRVHGVNFGNIYARSSLLGNMKSEKPLGMTWQQYAVFLLESLGIYAPELRDHYYRKINKFFHWWKCRYGISIQDIPDEGDRKLESRRKCPSWRRVARAVEKNDFWLKRLSFGPTKSDVRLLLKLRSKYRNLMDDHETGDRHLREAIASLKGEGAYGN